MFDRPILGCGCHGLQLPIGHVLPLLRRKTTKAKKEEKEDEEDEATDTGSESPSEADSDGHDSEWEDVADGEEDAQQHEDERQRLRKHISATSRRPVRL